MKKLLLITLLFAPILINAQGIDKARISLPENVNKPSYKQLADSALHTYWKGQDSVSRLTAYPRAYALYQQAFRQFPTEADGLGYDKAGFLAGELGKKEEAFSYLKKAVDNKYWDVALWSHAKEEFIAISNDPRWSDLVKYATVKKKLFLDVFANKQKALEAEGMLNKLNFNADKATSAYKKIKNYTAYPLIKDRFISMQLKINDTLHQGYLIALPPNYDPKKRYPVMFFLIGAVTSNTGFVEYAKAESDTGGWNRYYTKYAPLHNVIMVYPNPIKDYNWMYPDKGFFMVPQILKNIKQFINVDDNRVFITGHSNGATGSFSYLMKQPSPFAAFYGFNTRPRVATGGTFIRNILNRSWFNVSTDMDYYFPPGAHDSLTKVMKALGADYQDHRYNGFTHGFPQYNESEPAYKLLFADLDSRKRKPFKHIVYWECDDVKYGECDWMKITGLDTTHAAAIWQQNITFPIKKWIVFDKKNVPHEVDTLVTAFNYRHRSGAVKAKFENNVFTVETSNVKSFRLLLSPEMVDMSKPVSVIVNGKLYSKQRVKYDKEFMVDNFKNTLDRTAVWVNYIDVVLPQP